MSKKFRIARISDDQKCSACGRELKKSYWLVPLDKDGNDLDDPAPYGRDCAAEMLGWDYDSKFKKMFDKKIIEFRDARRLEIINMIREYKTAAKWELYQGKIYVAPEILDRIADGELSNEFSVVLSTLKAEYSFYDFDEVLAKSWNNFDECLVICDKYEAIIKNYFSKI